MELLLHFADKVLGVLDQGQSPGTPRRQVNLAAFVGVGLLGVVPGIFQALGLLFNPVFEKVRQLMPTVMLEKLPNMAFQTDYLALCWLMGLALLVVSTIVGLAVFQKKEIR